MINGSMHKSANIILINVNHPQCGVT